MVDHDELLGRVSGAIATATEHVWRRQRPDGGWTDRLSASAISTGLGALALVRADPLRYHAEIERSLDWLRANQRADGGWSMADDAPPSSPGASAFAIAAFEAVDPNGSRALIDHGMAFIEGNGGEEVIPGMRGPGPKTWPAAAPIAWSLVGLRDITEQPDQPVEVMLLPPRLRNKVSIALPAVLALGIMQSRLIPASWPRQIARRLAEPRALAWLRSAMGPNGGVEECAMLSALIYIGLHAAGVGQDVQRGSLNYLLDTQRPDGSWAIDRDLEIAVTAYVVLALDECGGVVDEPRLAATRQWLLSTQWKEPFPALKIPAGGWSWNVPSGWPESEDTAVVLTVLRLLGLTKEHPAVQTGLRWLRSRQNRDGSWSEWVRNSTILNDRPCSGVTSHVVMAFRAYGEVGGARSPVGRALRYFEATQQANGALPSLWFRDDVHGTAKVLEAYADIGDPGNPVALRARDFLLANQRPDGAWPTKVVVGVEGGTAEETAWALYSLLRAGVSPWDERVLRGVRWLVDQQNDEGTWRPSPVGLYFEDLCYSDDLIAHAYSLRALGRWQRCAREQARPAVSVRVGLGE